MTLFDDIVSLTKRRGFIFQNSDIYGGLANGWDWGPLGVLLKNNIKQLWWREFVTKRDDILGLDSSIILHPQVWEASGHTKEFSDPLIECRTCHKRFRADDIEGFIGDDGTWNEEALQTFQCPSCGTKGNTTSPTSFNLMFKTFLGASEESAHKAFLRPETAQGIFIHVKNVVDTCAPKLPFGIAQIGKAFRNEITPGNFIFRTREFEQMEIEYFIRPQEWETHFNHWEGELKRWIELVGIDIEKVHFVEVPETERAHYSKKTIDIEFDFPFGRKELYGLAYRGDFDLSNHQKGSGKSLGYYDEATKETFLPHVIEPSLGVERTILALLLSAYKKDVDEKGEERAYLDLPAAIAPYKVAVFPLLSNKSELVEKAKDIYKTLREKNISTIFDKGGNIGKRYRRQDEIGTPLCITVDFESLEDNTVTVRERNTMKQERVAIQDIHAYISTIIQ